MLRSAPNRREAAGAVAPAKRQGMDFVWPILAERRAMGGDQTASADRPHRAAAGSWGDTSSSVPSCGWCEMLHSAKSIRWVLSIVYIISSRRPFRVTARILLSGYCRFAFCIAMFTEKLSALDRPTGNHDPPTVRYSMLASFSSVDELFIDPFLACALVAPAAKMVPSIFQKDICRSP